MSLRKCEALSRADGEGSRSDYNSGVCGNCKAATRTRQGRCQPAIDNYVTEVRRDLQVVARLRAQHGDNRHIHRIVTKAREQLESVEWALAYEAGDHDEPLKVAA